MNDRYTLMSMKTIKYLMIGALMLGMSAPAMAQDAETKATIESVTNIIKEQPTNCEEQVKAVYKKNKKNAEVVLAIGRAYYNVKDTANAKTYAELAIKADKKYAKAFILLGDIEALNENGGGAAGQYQQAIYFDPDDPEAYFKYANVYRKVSPTEAVAKLEELRAHRPDVAVDALAGRIYYLSNDFDNAIESYSKVSMSDMEDRDITEYAMALYFTQQYQKSLEVAQYGLNKKPRDAAFNRLAFFNSTDLLDYEMALYYADALFNKSDSAKFSYFDYTYYGNALIGNKQPEEAIEAYKTALTMEFDNKDKKAGVLKQLSEGYKGINDYDQAIATYREYMNTVSIVSGPDYVGLGHLYTIAANDSAVTEEQKIERLKGAEAVYNEMEEKMPQFEEYTVYKKAQVNAMMDPETTEGLAKPYYEKLAGMLEPKEPLDDTDKVRLLECYRYLGYYNLLQNNEEEANIYWNKILEIDPENSTAKRALGLEAVE